MSHTLWTAWVCWSVGFLIELVATRRRTSPPIERTAPLHASP